MTGKLKNVSKSTKSDIYQAFFPLYHISKVLGLLPVRFVRQKNDQYLGRVIKIEILYGVCLLVLFIALDLWGLWRDLRDGWEHSTRLKSQTAVNITIGDVFAVAFLAAVGVIGAPFRWKYIEEMISRFVHADDKLGYITLKKTRRFAIILITSTMVSFIILSALDIYIWEQETKAKKKMPDKGPINYSPKYLLYLQALMMEIQCTIATYNLNERFIRLNKNLENILKSTRNFPRKEINLISEPMHDADKFPISFLKTEVGYKSAKRVFQTSKKPKWTSDERDSQDVVDAVSQLVSIHSSMCDINLLINKAFGFPILVVGLSSFIHSIITPYFMVMEANNGQTALFTTVQCLWCVLHFYQIMMLVQPCYAATKESKNTSVLINQLSIYNWQPDIRKQLDIFALQILHRPLVFSACGLFSLDRALVTSMAGAVTTYLVILLQFQEDDDTDGATNMLKNATLLLKNVSSLHNTTALKPTT